MDFIMKFKLTVDRIEGDNAVLKSAADNTVIWPKAFLPHDAKEGSILIFDISTKEEEEKAQKKQVKDILNEILDVN